MKLSIVIPCFNEAATIATVIRAAYNTALPCEKEILVVDDGSTDNSYCILSSLRQTYEFILLRNKKNKGKGASLQYAFSHSTGDYVLIQDADLEYSPDDYHKLLVPVLSGSADVIYGTRMSSPWRGHILNLLFNKLSSALAAMVTGRPITDVLTGYKLLPRDYLSRCQFLENGFGIEVELTLKAASVDGIRYSEVPINYKPRSYQDGKKIGYRDALRILMLLIRGYIEAPAGRGLDTAIIKGNDSFNK